MPQTPSPEVPNSSEMSSVRPPSRRALAISFAVSLAMLTGILVAIALSAPANAANYFANIGTAAGIVNWTATGIWGCGTVGPGDVCGTYPGQLANPAPDNANLGGTGTMGLTTSLPNPITLNTQNGINNLLLVFSGGVMTLTGTSQVTGTSGGTTFLVNGGVVTNNGTVAVTGTGPSMIFGLAGGTLNGTGVTNINSGGTFAVQGTQGPMTINTQTVNINSGGTANYTATAFGLALNGSIANASSFNFSGSAPISGTGSIANTGTFSTTSTSSPVGVTFNNGGSVTESVTGAKFSFTGGGTHTGTFNTGGTGGGFDFGGAHTFNGGAFTGGPVQNLSGGSWIVNAALTISGAFTNGGALSFGGVAQTISPSTFTQSGTGAFSPRLLSNGVNDKVTVTAGTATLGGTLSPSLGYTPAAGDSFVVLTSSADSGTMAYTPVTYPGGQVQASFNFANVSLAAVATADIAVSKAGPATVTAGQNVTYTVTITNLDTVNTASAIQIGDTPSGMTFVSNSGACTTPYPCTIASLGPGASATITSIFSVPASATGTVSNTANRVSSSPADTNAANDTSTVTSSVVQSADLTTTKTGPASALTGQTITFTTTVTNNGPSDAVGVSVADPTPAGLTFVSNTGACATTFPCSIGNLLPGGSATITSTYTVNATATSPVVNTATASATTPDPNSANNAGTASVAITAAADLGVTKSGPASVTAGQNVVYTIVVTNNGPSAANNVTVTDSTPAGTTFVSNAGACTTSFPCNVGTLNSGSSVTITSTYLVAPSATGSIVNTATVSAAGSVDSVPSNDSSTTTASVLSSTDFGVFKSGPATAAPNATIVYSVDVKNLGPSDALSPVTVSDPTPAGLTLLSVSGGGCTAYPCNVGPLAAGTFVTITGTYKVTATSGSVTNTASIPIAGDPNSINNVSSVTTTITPQADLLITKTGPSSIPASGPLTFTITVKNLGPSDALNVVVSDPTPARTSFLSNSGDCTTAFPCTFASLPAGATKIINASYSVSSAATSVTNTATVSATTADPNSSNNSASATAITTNTCPGAPTQVNPLPGATDAPVNGTIQWTSVGATSYEVYLGPAGSGCSTLLGTTGGTSFSYSGLSAGTLYESRIVAVKAGCQSQPSSCVTWSTGKPACTLPAVTLTDPAPNTTVPSPVTFKWSASTGAENYHVFAALNGGPFNDLGGTTDTALTATLGDGSVRWYVVASSKSCGDSTSATGAFNTCTPPVAPQAGVVGAPTSGQTYAVSWQPVPGAVSYLIDEATNDAFTNAVTQTTSQTTMTFTHSTTTGALVFFYRVRAVGSCSTTPGANSRTVRVVVLPPPARQKYPNFDIPAGTQNRVTLSIFIEGDPSGPQTFTITLDKPWMISVNPASGIVPPEGTTVQLTVDPAALPNGTFTGSLIVTYGTVSPNAMLVSNATTKKTTTPVTINLVTPIVPSGLQGPTADTIIIPAVGRLTGINSQWRSDVRIFNGSSQALKYQLDFVPSQASESKRTTLNTAAGDTTALDDIIHNWYGFGEVGDNAAGILQIRALTSSGAPLGSSLSTVVSSRTYNNTAASGTLGQFIPGILFSNFIGRSSGSVLSLQQLAQSSSYRTNLGVIEASGSPTSVLLSVLNAAGSKLTQDIALNLKAGEQLALNSLLADKGVTANDARIELRVTGGDGKVSAYASVVDNNSQDPQLVSPVILGQTTAQAYILPGVADLNTGTANWRSDLRILNGGSAPQTLNLLFYPQGNASNPVAAALTVNPGETKVLDNVLASLFSTTNAGGAVHVNTATSSQLVVTGRTFNQTSTGTLGQFIPAVTLADGIARAGKALNILQVEDSVRYRTNIGLAELSGNAATVEVTVNLPDSKVTPTVQIPLAANEFRQFALRDLGLENLYNARVSVQVINGSGRVTAYGSVIDMLTSDPTYVPAQ